MTRPVPAPLSNETQAHDQAPVVVALTGATASIIGFMTLKALMELDQNVLCIISSKSFQVIAEEMGVALPTHPQSQAEAVLKIIDIDPDSHTARRLTCLSSKDTGAPPASGTFLTKGMVIAPCSMTTLGKLASGIADNLVCRAADVTLKERRPLVLVPRESPLNRIHLQNMLTVHDAGARLVPPVLSFYKPAFNTVDGQLMHTVGKVLDQLGFTQHQLSPRWSGMRAADPLPV